MGRKLTCEAKASILFNTKTSSIALGNNIITGSGAITIAMWIKKARVQLGSTPHLFWLGSAAVGNLFRCYKNIDTWVFTVHGVDTVTISDSLFPQGEWTRLVVTRGSGVTGVTMVYINGSKVGEGAACALNLLAGDPMYFSYVGSDGYVGRLWDFRIINAEWSQQRVEQDWNGEEDNTNLVFGLWCDNLSSGTTTERVSSTTKTVTGGSLDVYDVPFKQSRIIENIVSCPAIGTIASLSDSDALKPSTNSFSLIGWFRRSNFAGDAYIFGRSSGASYILIYFNSAGSWRFEVSDSVVTSKIGTTYSHPRKQWVHGAFVLDRTSGLLLFYENSVLRATAALGALGSLSFNAATTYIAATTSGQANDMWWYNGKALSSEEIRSHYLNGTIPSAGASTRIGWTLQDGTGTTLTSIPTGYNGTLSAANWTTATRSKKHHIVRNSDGCLNFATNTSSIALGNNPITGSGAITIAMWIKKQTEQLSADAHFFWFGSAVAGRLFRAVRVAGVWRFEVWSVDSIDINDTWFNKREWNRLVVTRNSGASGITKVYINGELISQGLPCAMDLQAADSAYFSYIGAGNGYTGRLWDLRVLNTEWSSNRVKQDWCGEEDENIGLVQGLWCDNLSGGNTTERVSATAKAVTGGTLDTNDVPFKERTLI